MKKNFFKKIWDQVFGKAPIYAETPVHSEPWDGILDLDHYIRCTAVKGASNKFKKISSFLVSTFLEDQDLDKIRVSNFDPIGKTIEKQPSDIQQNMISKILNNLSQHIDLKVGALRGCIEVDGIDEPADVVERRLTPFSKLIYLNALSNKLKFLESNKSVDLTSENRAAINFYRQILEECLDYDNILFNDRIRKVDLRKSLARRPSVDTNLEDLKSL